MPIARFELPDGRVARFEVPEGTTPEQAQSLIESHVRDNGLSSLDPAKRALPEGVEPSDIEGGRGYVTPRAAANARSRGGLGLEGARPFVAGERAAPQPGPSGILDRPDPGYQNRPGWEGQIGADEMPPEAAKRRAGITERPAEMRASPEPTVIGGLADKTLRKPFDNSMAGAALETVGDAARGIARSSQGVAGSIYSAGQAAAEAVGAGDTAFAGVARGAGKAARSAREATGNPRDRDSLTQQVFESTFTNLPVLASLGTGNAALLAMGAMSAANDYGESRDAGKTHDESLGRAAFMGTAEIIGERFGLPQLGKLFERAAAKATTKELGGVLADLLWKEQIGEQVTTALQSGYEKFGAQGRRPDMTLGDYLDDVANTAKVTLGQTLLMGAGAAGARALVGKNAGAVQGVQTPPIPPVAPPPAAPMAPPQAPAAAPAQATPPVQTPASPPVDPMEDARRRAGLDKYGVPLPKAQTAPANDFSGLDTEQADPIQAAIAATPFGAAAQSGIHFDPPMATDAPQVQRTKIEDVFRGIAATYGLPRKAVDAAIARTDAMPNAQVGRYLAGAFSKYLEYGVIRQDGLSQQHMAVLPTVLGALAHGPVMPVQQPQDFAGLDTEAPNAGNAGGVDGQQPADAGRGAGVVGVPDDGPGNVLASPAGAAGQGVAGAAGSGAGTGRADALKAGDRVTLDGKTWSVIGASDALVKLDDGAGKKRAIQTASPKFAEIAKVNEAEPSRPAEATGAPNGENLQGQGQAGQVGPTEVDPFAELFGADYATRKAEPVVDTEAINASKIKEAVAEARKTAKAAHDDWAGRVYKTNKTQVELRGDGPKKDPSMSIGAINEGKRRKAMESYAQELRAMDAVDAVMADPGKARMFVRELNDLRVKAQKAFESGNWPHYKDAGAMFESMFLGDMLKLKGPGGYGNVESNGVSRAVRAALEAKDDAQTQSPATEADQASTPAAAPAAAPAVVPGAGRADAQADGVKADEPWKLTREQAAKDFPGDEYDRMLNRYGDLGELPYVEVDRRARTNAMGQRKLWAKTRAQLEQEGKDAVKAARGDRAATNKLKSTPEFANWRLKAMSLKGKEAIAEAERLARDYLAIHKDRVQEALMEGKDVPAEVMADYPDLKRPTKNAEAPVQAPSGSAAEAPAASAPLYASRPVTNAADIMAWAASQGFKSTLPANDLHVTVAYSREPVDGGKVSAAAEELAVTGGKRTVEPLGDEGAVALKFSSTAMQARWKQYRDAGASWDYESYTPHITITYDGAGVDLSKVKPYTGPILLGAEKQEPLNVDKAADYKDAGEVKAAPDVSTKPEKADTSAERVQKAAESEQVAPATHKDPGEPAEPVTPAVVREAIKTAAENEGRSRGAMKADALRLIDEAIARAASDKTDDGSIVIQEPITYRGKKEITAVRKFAGDDESIQVKAREGSDGKWEVTDDSYDGSGTGRKKNTRLGGLVGTPAIAKRQLRDLLMKLQPDGTMSESSFVEIRVPGDGVFKVRNTREALAEFRRKVEASPGFKDRQPRPSPEDAGDGYQRGSGSKLAAFSNMVEDGDIQAALDYAEAVGIDPKTAKLTDVLRRRLDMLMVEGVAKTADQPAAIEQPATPAPAPAAEPEPPALDLKGFTRTPRGNGAFDLSDGNMRVSVEPTERGKYQARFGSAKSSPHLQGEQAAVDWAAQYREDAAPKAEPAPAPQAEPADAPLTAADVPADLKITLEYDGKTKKVDAAKALKAADQRVSNLRLLLDCVKKG